jgi:hypothetical protein
MADAGAIYDVAGTFANIDANAPRILALGGLSLICNFTFFGSAAYLGFKHKMFTMPLVGTLIFIPHDFHYLLMYDRWFNVYDHWFMKLFFAGLVVTNILELIFFYQTLKWGRKEILPQVSQSAYVAILLVALAAAAIVWVGVKSVLADELWFFSFGWTIWFCIPLVIPMMLRRGSALGQSMLMWLAYIVMAVCWWAAVWPLDPFFRSPVWVGLGVVTVFWGIATIAVMRRLPNAKIETPSAEAAFAPSGR